MNIRIQSVKFNADVKLLDFIEKKVGKLEKYNNEIVDCEVTLTLLPDNANKCVKIIIYLPQKKEIFIEKNANTFEDAIVDCVDALKEQMVRIKEKNSPKGRIIKKRFHSSFMSSINISVNSSF